MELEREGCLPFWDVLVYRKNDGFLGRKVYRKQMHKNLYLNNIHHYPAPNKLCFLLWYIVLK